LSSIGEAPRWAPRQPFVCVPQRATMRELETLAKHERPDHQPLSTDFRPFIRRRTEKAPRLQRGNRASQAETLSFYFNALKHSRHRIGTIIFGLALPEVYSPQERHSNSLPALTPRLASHARQPCPPLRHAARHVPLKHTAPYRPTSREPRRGCLATHAAFTASLHFNRPTSPFAQAVLCLRDGQSSGLCLNFLGTACVSGDNNRPELCFGFSSHVSTVDVLNVIMRVQTRSLRPEFSKKLSSPSPNSRSEKITPRKFPRDQHT